MLKLESAIDRLELNLYKMSKTGIILPPPPIPAAADSKITRKRAIVPIISPHSKGYTSLCSHIYVVSSHNS